MTEDFIPPQQVTDHIHIVRGQKIILDFDLAALYGVPTKRLNEQVRRNLDRFPSDFMFQVTENELEILRSQFATSSWGGRRRPPYAFTEHGALMAANVLNSQTAIKVSLEVIRAFIQLRQILVVHRDLEKKLNDLEKKYDAKFKVVFDTVKQLMIPPEIKRRRIGIHNSENE
jgi:hypothetical protein